MSGTVNSLYYNYYNVKGRYSPSTPETPAWRKIYEVIDDRVESNNSDPESEIYQAHCKLEDIYYNSSVSNRAKYKDEHSLKQALSQKYLFGAAYSQYDYAQRRAMYENELNMTMFGTCGNMNDPRLGGSVKGPTDTEQAVYNRKMVNTQISNILSLNGIDVSLLDGMIFSMDSFDHKLTVTGVEEHTARLIERLLNCDGNNDELFYHVLQSSRSRINEDVMAKYRAVQNFKEITGEDLRNYHQMKDGFVDEQGRNALDVYKEALKNSTKVPAEFKGTAWEFFKGNLQVLMSKNFAGIADLNLQIGFSGGILQDDVCNTEIMRRFDLYA